MEKDEGISDVIALLKDVDIPKESPKAVMHTQSYSNQNGLNETNTTNEDSTESEIHKITGNFTDEDKDNVTKAEHDTDAENTPVDLSNPEQILQMLETVDLTEEDTEVLLQEAYTMNKKLKEILRRQEKSNDASKSKSDKKRPKKFADDFTSSVSSTSSLSNSRLGSASLRRAVLPPIEKESTGVYAVKLQRSRTNMADVRQIPSHAMVPRSKSSQKVDFFSL